MDWNKILLSNCEVFQIGSRVVYPIYRCGYTTFKAVKDKTYKNNQISFRNIDVLIRDPADRFVSGVNEYARQNKLDVEDTWNLIAENKLIDKHFAPQYIWLMHLHKFHKGTVTLYPFSDIKKFTNTHKGKWNNKKHGEKLPLAQIENFVDKDLLLLKHLNKTVTLKELLKNVLS